MPVAQVKETISVKQDDLNDAAEYDIEPRDVALEAECDALIPIPSKTNKAIIKLSIAMRQWGDTLIQQHNKDPHHITRKSRRLLTLKLTKMLKRRC